MRAARRRRCPPCPSCSRLSLSFTRAGVWRGIPAGPAARALPSPAAWECRAAAVRQDPVVLSQRRCHRWQQHRGTCRSWGCTASPGPAGAGWRLCFGSVQEGRKRFAGAAQIGVVIQIKLCAFAWRWLWEAKSFFSGLANPERQRPLRGGNPCFASRENIPRQGPAAFPIPCTAEAAHVPGDPPARS